MKPNKKAQWIVGITGTTLSAFILSQLDAYPSSNKETNQPVAYQTEVSAKTANVSSAREQELANKDWSNFKVVSNTEKKSTAVASNQSTANTVKRSTANQSTNAVRKSTTSQSNSQSTSRPAAQPSQPATHTIVNQPVVQQQPVAPPPTNRNTSRS